LQEDTRAFPAPSQQLGEISLPSFPVEELRKTFPALERSNGFTFFDNAAGAQIPQMVLDAVNEHLVMHNVQRGGRYPKSQAVDAMIAMARESVAMFLNVRSPAEVAFGMNATSFLRLVSLAMTESLHRRPEIVVTDLDHEANIAVWLALQRFGAKIRWWCMREDGRLHAEDLDGLLSGQTRLVACTAASNALGSLVDLPEVARRAHAVGAELLLDAVHYGPHGIFDVQAWNCDYLVCSGYKIFAPHMGFLWGRRELLANLPTFREEFIPDVAPGKIEAGTFVYENVAGMNAAIAYLESLGSGPSRRAALVKGMEAIRRYEASLSMALLNELASIPGVAVYGVRDPAEVAHRVPTVCFNLRGVLPATVCERLAAEGIGVRDGHMYAPRLMDRLSLSRDTGAVRVSLVHYNTHEEIQRFAAAVRKIASS
jgi:cysteine desulfurase family protein (TIGR01976 family)